MQVRPAEPERPPAALAGCRVVVVEDDVEIRAAMMLLLEGWGCDVHAASSGEALDAVFAAMPGPPDALIADFRLPGSETGIDVVLRVRKRFPRTFGILVSGDVTPGVLRAARLANIDLLHKPLRPARLRALLGTMRARLAAAPQAVPVKEGA
jgi:CheY-like chemotaxis protein